jgi:cephalosporin hydroxylase
MNTSGMPAHKRVYGAPITTLAQACREYLRSHPEFVIDSVIDDEILISVAPSGCVKRIS